MGKPLLQRSIFKFGHVTTFFGSAILISLLALSQGVYICACPVISMAVVTQTQFSRKTRKARNKLYLQKLSLDTILTLIPVYIVITLLLALFQGVNICARPVISTAIVTQTQFTRKTRKC